MNNQNAITPDLANLLDAARQAACHSYSPYSGFKVGAALKLAGGEIVTGTNVENISFGLTICAERAALVRAVSQFGPGIRIEAVAVANLNGAASPPCGACRQIIWEFCGDIEVLLANLGGKKARYRISELFPLPFDKGLLEGGSK